MKPTPPEETRRIRKHKKGVTIPIETLATTYKRDLYWVNVLVTFYNPDQDVQNTAEHAGLKTLSELEFQFSLPNINLTKVLTQPAMQRYSFRTSGVKIGLVNYRMTPEILAEYKALYLDNYHHDAVSFERKCAGVLENNLTAMDVYDREPSLVVKGTLMRTAGNQIVFETLQLIDQAIGFDRRPLVKLEVHSTVPPFNPANPNPTQLQFWKEPFQMTVRIEKEYVTSFERNPATLEGLVEIPQRLPQYSECLGFAQIIEFHERNPKRTHTCRFEVPDFCETVNLGEDDPFEEVEWSEDEEDDNLFEQDFGAIH